MAVHDILGFGGRIAFNVVQAPPFPGVDAASSDRGPPATVPVNNESGGNQEIERWAGGPGNW